MVHQTQPIYQFGPFRLESSEHRLLRDGKPLPLPHKAFEVLLVLVESPGRLVLKEDVLNRVWPEIFVEEANLAVAVSQLRKALGDIQNGQHRYIETVRTIGYRFVAPVQVVGSGPVAPAPAAPHRNVRVRILLAVAVAVLLLAGAGYFLTRKTNRAAMSRGITAIAVLPLENLSHDPEQEYFADGMTEELITNLASISSLKVISRTSVMRYKKVRKPLPELAHELGVEAVVEGTVMRTGDRVRINAQLVHAPTDTHLWAASYDRELRDVFALSSEISQAIAHEVEANLSPAERQQFASARPVNPQAYEAYLHGEYYWNQRTTDGFNRAVELFGEAIRLDPSFAPAYAGLAKTYAIWYYNPLPVEERLARARNAALRALALDDSLAEAHLARAYLMHRFEWNWDGAEAEFKRALQLNPGSMTAHQWYAIFLMSMGRFQEAVSEAQHIRSLDPLSPAAAATLGRVLYFARRFPEATQQLQSALQLDPNFVSARYDLAQIYAINGKAHEAVNELQQVRDQNRTDVSLLATLAYAYGKAGQTLQARALLADIQKRLPSEHVAPSTMAFLFVGLADYDHAVSCFEREYSERGNYLPFLNTDPGLDPLRSNPRFQRLLSSLRFPAPSAGQPSKR